MAALVSVADLQAYMKVTFSGADLTQANAVLIGVSAIARAVSGQAWSDAPSNVPEDVQAVVKLATKRLLERLARDESVQSKTKGPFSVSYFDNPEELFTRGELGILRRFRTQSGLFTIGSSRGETTRYNDWWLTDNPYLEEWVDQFHEVPDIPW